MSGVERLRALAGAWDECGLGGALAEIADEIERERAEDCYRMGLDYGTVLCVVADMERHCLGHEGMEDSPVARWARELRGALGTTVSRQEIDAVAWVREHGGLDHVRVEWSSRSNLKRMYEKLRAKVERQQRHIEFVQGKCRERQKHIVELSKKVEEMLPRLMPEGYEWPRYESGESVGFGDDVSRHGKDFEANVITLYRDGSFSLNFWAYSKGERVKRVKRPQVLAADGEPLEVGQTVWPVEGGGPLYVDRVDVGGQRVTTRPFGLSTYLDETEFEPSQLTHTKPEPPDSAERIADEIDRLREEVALHLGDYLYDEDGNDSIQFSMELVAKRCRALAERERGE